MGNAFGAQRRAEHDESLDRVRMPLWAMASAFLLAWIGFGLLLGSIGGGISILLALLATVTGPAHPEPAWLPIVPLTGAFLLAFGLHMRGNHRRRLVAAICGLLLAALVGSAIAGAADPALIAAAGLAVMQLLFRASVAALVAFEEFSSLAHWRHNWLSRGQCPSCGYGVRGLPDRRCPECGTTWPA